jgi:hypothetical protein
VCGEGCFRVDFVGNKESEEFRDLRRFPQGGGLKM